jgi:hypothetical protein
MQHNHDGGTNCWDKTQAIFSAHLHLTWALKKLLLSSSEQATERKEI